MRVFESLPFYDRTGLSLRGWARVCLRRALPKNREDDDDAPVMRVARFVMVMVGGTLW